MPKLPKLPETPLAVLIKARELIAIGWGRESYKKRVAGRDCYCAQGAIYGACGSEDGRPSKALRRDLAEEADRILTSAVNTLYPRNLCAYLPSFNDAQKSKRPVLRAFDAAIQLAREQKHSK